MRVARMVAAIGCVVLLAAGCGGSDDTSTGATTTAAPSDDGGTTDGSGTDGSSTDAGLGAGFVPEDCQFLLAGASLNPLAGAVPGSQLDLGDSARQLEAIADKAPDDIKDAMRTISEGFALFADALKDVDMSDPAALAAFSSWCDCTAVMTAAVAALMNSGRFSAAQSRLDSVETADPWNRGNT